MSSKCFVCDVDIEGAWVMGAVVVDNLSRGVLFPGDTKCDIARDQKFNR